jgi:predicted Kef-type K+ transport protein
LPPPAFSVGLHFSVKDRMAVRRIAVPVAVVQIATATAIGAAMAHFWGWSLPAGLTFGLALSVASTVVLLRALEQQRKLDSPDGRVAVGWLIVEDLAMVLALALLPAIANALGAGSAGVAGALGGDPGFAVAIGIAFGSAKLFGVSFALGAFFAGVILSEPELSHRAAEDSLPLQDAFAVLFFVSVGMLFDPSVLLREPLAVLGVVLVIVIGKSLAAFLIVLAFRYPVGTALTISASLAQIGEFSFILMGLGIALQLLPAESRDLILAGALISIALNPFGFAGIPALERWIRSRPRLLARLERKGAAAPACEPPPDLPHGASPRSLPAPTQTRKPSVVEGARMPHYGTAPRGFTRHPRGVTIGALSGGPAMSTTIVPRRSAILALAVAASCSTAVAQTPPKQVVKPPVSQAWLDVATFSGLPMGGMGPGGGGMMNATLGALMGGGKSGKAEFGYTQTGTTGRWMDVTLYTSRNPNLAEALQGVPDATGLAPTLKLQTPEKPKPAPRTDIEDEPAPVDYEPPKGKFLLYWGCSESVRPGQPKVLNLETATLAEFGKFMESRRATQRGTHAAAGRPIWPSKTDKRALPAGASLVGQHSFTGQGVPESFKFGIAAAQDIMPEIKLRQTDTGNSILLEWEALPTARAYFLGSMGAREGSSEDDNTMVIWTSSELPDSGFGLFDYQTNTAVDRWLKEKVLLPPATTKCAVPKEAAAQGMLRAIAYGTEVNMAYPPRPTDANIPWEPDWNVKIRVKSMTTSMFGMSDMPGAGGVDGSEEMTDAPPPNGEAPPAEQPKKKKKLNPFDVVKDVVKDQLP